MKRTQKNRVRQLTQGLLFMAATSLANVVIAGSPFFSTLSMRDGLPSSIISGVVQDKYHFIWVGTGSGLARYDGYNFINFYKSESPNSIPSNGISALIPDGEYIWVGTWAGLCRINVVTFEITRIDLGDNIVIRTLHKDHRGTIWIGTASGLIRYSGSNGNYRIYNKQNNNLSHNTVRSIYVDKLDNLWVGTYDKLNKLPSGSDRFVSVDLKGNYSGSLKNNLILDIKPADAADSLLWVGTETGLCLVNPGTMDYKRCTPPDSRFSNEVIKYIYKDGTGKLWLGTDFGLNVFDPSRGTNETYFHNPRLSYSIANNVIWQIYEDSGGVLWFVTSNGLSRLNLHGNFYDYEEITHSLGDQTIGNQVKSILIARSGAYWLATQHGTIRFDPVTREKTVFDTSSGKGKQLLSNNVYALNEDNLGRIWIGTASGINVWDPLQSKMYSITSSQTNGLGSNYIGKFTRAADGTLWMSAWEGGFYRIEGDPREINALKFNAVSHVGSEKHVSGADALWVIEYDGLYRVDLKTLHKTHVPAFAEASQKRNIYCLYASSAGSVWAGAQNGLMEYDPASGLATFHPIVTGNDIIISNIIEDDHGNIWGSTNTALIKLYAHEQRQEVFPLDRNIPIKSFYYGCAAKTPSGEIVVGGDNGFVTFSPAQVRAMTYRPDVYITRIEINNRSIIADEPVEGDVLLENDISFTRTLTLRYAQRSIAFEFSSLHYWQPSTNVYAYKMEGVDDGWNYVSGTKNFAVYSNLAPGNYKLTVRGSNNYGIWSDKTAVIAITVKPPLFLSAGFLALYVALLCAAIYYALKTYSARVYLKNELRITRMEKEHAEEIERTKERFFTNISHELRTPISLILPPIHEFLKRSRLDNESKRLIVLAEKNSRRLLRLVNQILDFKKLEDDTLKLKVSAIDLVSFCYEVYTLFADKASRNEIQFLFTSRADECTAWVDPEKIETVLFNLLSNAFKFTPAGGRIELMVGPYSDETDFPYGAFEIKVRDNGIGISPEEQSKVFDRFYQSNDGSKMDVGSGIGLTLSAEYVRLHHGEIVLESAVGMGTTFAIHLPLSNKHFPVDSIHERCEIELLATKSVLTNIKGSKAYHFDLHSEKPMVLIIDDNPEMVEFIRLSLGHKYNFTSAENGEEGLLKARSFLPRIIISDIMMPVMDGLTFCRKIKESPGTAQISIILLTARTLTAQKVEGVRSGADVYLTKPIDMELLDASMEHLLQRTRELSDYFRNELLMTPNIGSKKENAGDSFIRRVMAVVEAHISDPDFSVEKLGTEIGMSSAHLYRKLKSLTHLSANEIIKRYRIKKASLLLENNEGNISEIMYEVGFSNLSYFSKCFKAEFGMTPREYQQEKNRQSGSMDRIEELKG